MKPAKTKSSTKARKFTAKDVFGDMGLLKACESLEKKAEARGVLKERTRILKILRDMNSVQVFYRYPGGATLIHEINTRIKKIKRSPL